GFAVNKAKQDLQHFEYVPPELGEEDVEVQITHNGLCHTDMHMRDNDWGISKYPFIPGHEIVGVLVAKGNKVSKFKVGGFIPGDRVGFGWIRDSCGSCYGCNSGQENLCREGYTGTIVGGNFGGFQKRGRFPAKMAYKIPAGLPSAEAAPLLCAGNTVYNPLKEYITRPGMRVGILGVGGLGHLAVQFANAMGAQVVGISTSPSKRQEVLKLGAHEFCLESEMHTQLAGSLDLLLNTAPCPTDTSKLMGLLTNAGTLCYVGIPNTEIKVGMLDLVFNQKKVVGSIVSGRRDCEEMLALCARRNIYPQIEVMPLSQINEAMQHVMDNKARYRVVLETDIEDMPVA
ncbi:unnamed protein product, partial [Heterosigma akashiwo]